MRIWPSRTCSIILRIVSDSTWSIPCLDHVLKLNALLPLVIPASTDFRNYKLFPTTPRVNATENSNALERQLWWQVAGLDFHYLWPHHRQGQQRPGGETWLPAGNMNMGNVNPAIG